MNLLERYLQAVRWWLPPDAEPDLVDELADDLHSQIEEREGKLGRALNETELAAILERCGHPMSVAGRLMPAPGWLDPVSWVLYRFVLRHVLGWVLPAVIAIAHLPRLLASSQKAMVLVDLALSLLRAEIFSFVVITGTFLLVANRKSLERLQRGWNVRTLPPVRDTRRIPRTASAFEAVIGWLFIVWWSGVVRPLVELTDSTLPGNWGELWRSLRAEYYWPVLILACANLALSLVALARPYWTRTRLAVRAVINAGVATTLALAARPHWSGVTDLLHRLRGVKQLAEADRLEAVIGLALSLAIMIGVVIAAVSALADLVRWARWRDDEPSRARDRR